MTDLRCRSMRDNLVMIGISEHPLLLQDPPAGVTLTQPPAQPSPASLSNVPSVDVYDTVSTNMDTTPANTTSEGDSVVEHIQSPASASPSMSSAMSVPRQAHTHKQLPLRIVSQKYIAFAKKFLILVTQKAGFTLIEHIVLQRILLRGKKAYYC